MNIEVKKELRPCVIHGKKHLFHCWYLRQDVVSESPLAGGYPAGQVSRLYGVVENEAGQIDLAPPLEIEFVDNKIENYCFDTPAEKKEINSGENETEYQT